MSVINSFIAQLKLSAQPEVGATEQIQNLTDTQVFLRTVGNVPNDITGVTFYVSSAVPSNATISINDSIPLPLGSSIGFGYAPGNATALEDLISGLVTNPSLVASAGSIITVDVTYYARDMSPATGGPTLSLVSASVEDANPDQIVLTFSSALDGASVPATTDFTVSGGKTVNNVAIAGSAITLTVDSAYINSDTITVSHTPGGNPITGTNTATAGAFSNFAVTNNIAGVTDTTAPTAVLVGVLPTATTGVAATVVVDFTDETDFNPASVTIGSLSAVDGANVATIAIASTTAIGNNGVRVDFDVTAPVDGSYTVTVPVNSYADTAGNQGSLVNLGTMTASGAADTTAPTAVLVGVLPTATTGVAATVTVDFDDETSFNPSSVTVASLSAVDGANVATIAISNTTTIGNNGVRVDFDVTAPVDGSYTVTIPVNSYSDVAGNQGVLVNLGVMTSASASAGVAFSGLTSGDNLLLVNAGQSNSGLLDSEYLSSTFSTNFGTNFNGATVTFANSNLGSTGFINGTGEWVPGKTLATNLVAAINSNKGSATRIVGVWWQGEADANTTLNASVYPDQLVNLTDYIEAQTELRIDWVIVRLNPASNANEPAALAAAQDTAIAANSNYYLANIDAFTLADGLHYTGQYQTIFDTVIQPVIDSNNLLKTVASVASTYTPVTGGGVVLDHDFVGTAGALIGTLTPTTGTGFNQIIASNLEASGSGSVTLNGSFSNPDRWAVGSPDLAVGEVIRIASTIQIGNPARAGFVGFRYAGTGVRYLALSISQAGEVGLLVRDDTTILTIATLPSVTPTVDNRHTVSIEFSSYEVRYQINSEPIQSMFNSTYPFTSGGVARIAGGSNFIEDFVIEGLTAFTL